VPIEVLESMTDDELAAAIDGQRKLRAVEGNDPSPDRNDSSPEDDDAEDDDGLPPEVVISDPGPRALAPAPSEPEPDDRE
jgi:hypothetical protein